MRTRSKEKAIENAKTSVKIETTSPTKSCNVTNDTTSPYFAKKNCSSKGEVSVSPKGTTRKRKADKTTELPSKKRTKKTKAIKVKETKDSSDDDSETDWMEVEEVKINEEAVLMNAMPSCSHVSPIQGEKKPLEITVHKLDKKKLDAEKLLKLEIARAARELKLQQKKIYLLCYVAHLIHLSTLCNDTTLQALLLSLVPSGFLSVSTSAFNISVLLRLTKWFKSAFPIQPVDDATSPYFCTDFKNYLHKLIDEKNVHRLLEAVVLYACVLRALGLQVRLLCCVPLASFETVIRTVKVTEKKPHRGKEQTLNKATHQETNKQKKEIPKWKDEPLTKAAKSGTNYFLETYLETEDRWINVCAENNFIDDCRAIEKLLVKPVRYVLGVDNDLCIKDLTAKYTSTFDSWNLRCDEDWWTSSLRPYRTKNRSRSLQEDIDIHNAIMRSPLPSTVAGFKNHPFFVLERNLKKYEAIYPKDTKPVGKIKDEAVYARSAVRHLHAKEFWVKEARVIRTGEEPYKIVKGRPKPGTPRDAAERPLPLFGFWQTEPFIPKPAVDGVVPRNEYGNVELFKPSMLPPGTVHLLHPGLLQVAKKLDIDCAPAMVGWDFHGHGSHPLFNGVVVCEEFKETLLDAWDHEEAQKQDREQTKISERALRNWARLTRALTIRRKLTFKFKFGKTNQHLI